MRRLTPVLLIAVVLVASGCSRAIRTVDEMASRVDKSIPEFEALMKQHGSKPVDAVDSAVREWAAEHRVEDRVIKAGTCEAMKSAAAEGRAPTKDEFRDAVIKSFIGADRLTSADFARLAKQADDAKAKGNQLYFVGIAVWCDLPRQ
jgi:hypothetical protein